MATVARSRCRRSETGTGSSVHYHAGMPNQEFTGGDRVACPLFLELKATPSCDILEIRMANTVSALKRVRIAERRTAVNRTRKTRLRHQIRAMRRLLESKDAKGATAAVPKTFSVIDRAAKWGIIKKNTAARYKSRLTIRLRKIAAA